VAVAGFCAHPTGVSAFDRFVTPGLSAVNTTDGAIRLSHLLTVETLTSSRCAMVRTLAPSR
jgi:hypothetical protein